VDIGKTTSDEIYFNISDFHLKILTQENHNMFTRTRREEMLLIVFQIPRNLRVSLKLKVGKR